MDLFIILLASFFLLLAICRLDLALSFIIIALPSYLIRFKVLGVPSTLLELMILLAAAVWLIGYFLPNLKSFFKNRKDRLPYPFQIEILLIIILSFIAAGVAGFSSGALGIWKAYFFEPILLFLIFFNVFKNKRDWDKIFWALLISALTISGMAIYQKLTGLFIFNEFWAQAETRRAVSWFGYPNAIGLYLAPLILIFFGALMVRFKSCQNDLKEWLKRILIIFTIISSFLAIYFARSEGALIAIIISLVIFGLLAGKWSRIITLLITIIVTAGILSSGSARNYTFSKLTLTDLSGEIRQRQWQETRLSLQGWKFFTGHGLNNYQAAVRPYHQEGIFFNRDGLPNFDDQLRGSASLREKYWQPVEIYLYPHNFFLNFWSELGLLGALVFSWLVIKSLYITFKLTIINSRFKNPEKYFTLGLFGAILTIIIHGLVDVPYFKNDLAILFWTILALIGFAELQQKNIINHPRK